MKTINFHLATTFDERYTMEKRKQSSSGTSFRNLRIYRIIESGNYVYYFQYQTYDSVLLKRRRRGRLRRRPYFYRIDIHLRIPYPDHCARITVHPKLNVTQEERKHQIFLTKQRPRDDGSVHIYPNEIPSGIESNWTGAIVAVLTLPTEKYSVIRNKRGITAPIARCIIFNSDFRISAL